MGLTDTFKRDTAAPESRELSTSNGGFLTRLNDRDGYIRKFSRRYGGAKAAELERFVKFLFVGALGAVIDLGLTNLLMILFHVQDGDVHLVVVAGSIGFICAVCSNFFWNRYWTYPDSRSRRIRHQLALFFLISFFGLVIRAVVVGLFSNPFAEFVTNTAHSMNLVIEDRVLFKIGANMAVIMALVIVALWNFFANRYVTYNDVDKSAAPQTTP